MLVQVDLFQNKVYNSECKYCGKPFNKVHNREMYCSDTCCLNALREQKAKYQRKRRLNIKSGLIIVDEIKRYGVGSYGTSLSEHPKSNFHDELVAIQKEKRRLKL